MESTEISVVLLCDKTRMHLNIYELIRFKFSMMIVMIEIYILMLV